MSDPITTNAVNIVSHSGLSDGGKFWWNWAVYAASATATLLAVFVALFKDALLKPQLRLQLRNSNGEKTPATLILRDIYGERRTQCAGRFYHMNVSNKRSWAIARNVQVHLLKVEEPVNGDWVTTWDSEVPIGWQHQAVTPFTRTIGPTRMADLCCVLENGVFQIYPVIEPSNLKIQLRGQFKMILHLRAKGDEGESNLAKVLIEWDGVWEEGEKEMLTHFRIKQIA